MVNNTLPVNDNAKDETSPQTDASDPVRYQEVFRPRHRLCKLSAVSVIYLCVRCVI